MSNYIQLPQSHLGVWDLCSLSASSKAPTVLVSLSAEIKDCFYSNKRDVKLQRKTNYWCVLTILLLEVYA